jgi:hypothetical protein
MIAESCCGKSAAGKKDENWQAGSLLHEASMSRLTVFCGLVLSLGLSRGAVAAPLTSERMLPKRTLALVKIPNADEFRRRWNASSFGAMQRDPAFAPFFADLERQADRLAGGVKRTLGVGVKQLWLALDGELAVALVHTPESGLAFVGIAEIAPDEPSAARRLAALEATLVAHGARDLRIKAGDLDVVSWSVGSGDDQAKFSYFRRGNRLVLSQDLNGLLSVAAAAKSDVSETLAANPVYQYIVQETQASSGEPALRWYVDPIGALRAAVSDNLEGNPNRDVVTGLLSQAGVDKFKGIGGTIELGSAFADNVSRTFGYVEPPVSGLLEAFALPAVHQVPPNWVKEDANLYMQINWNGPRFYRAIASFFDSYQGKGAFNALVGSGQIPNTEATFHDAVDQLEGPVHVVATFPTSTGDLLKQPAVFAVQVRDAKKTEAMLHGLAQAAGARERSVGGAATFTLPLGVPGAAPAVGLCFCVAHGSLMVSTSDQYLQSVLTGAATKRPLSKSAVYKAATGQFPEKTSLVSFARQDQRFEQLYEQIRSGGFRIPLYGGVVSSLGLDFSKLPPASAVRPYLETSAGFVEPADKGFRMIEIGYWPERPPEQSPKANR